MSVLPVEVPVQPGPDEARQWLYDELAKPEYVAAQPTWFDLLVQRILEWFDQFQAPIGQAGGFPWWVVVLLVIVAVIVIAVVRVVGLPRLLRRRKAAVGALFGDDDDRDAATMRRDARRAAAGGDYTTAVAELYRAMARDLDERTLVAVLPGTTAHGFARGAAAVFPAEGGALETSASDFDAVRYLDGTGSREQWDRLAALDERLRAARPRLEAVGA